MTPPVFVAVFVGTDHHPFDRLVSNVERWLSTTAVDARVVIQHGASAAPALAEGMPMVGHEEVTRIMHDADVVVCHGGPATIADARAAGHRPLVMPRDPRRGEHVDNHQMLFAARLATAGLVTLVADEIQLVDGLEAAAATPRPRTGEAGAGSGALVGGDDIAVAVGRIGALVDQLVDQSSSRSRGRLAGRLERRRARSAA